MKIKVHPLHREPKPLDYPSLEDICDALLEERRGKAPVKGEKSKMDTVLDRIAAVSGKRAAHDEKMARIREHREKKEKRNG